jgi:O-antigen/teichoic acid export membrane protein
MAKIVAFAAYFYQAAVAFGLLIIVAHVLSPADYSRYSLFISISQFTAIFCFEWIRFACSRFYPGRTEKSERSERRALSVEFTVSAVFCILAAAASIFFGVSPVIALFGGLVAVLQGASDLHLTMLRFRQQFRSFSRLQGSRASILAIGTLGGAALDRTFVFTAGGLLAGYVVYTVLAVLMTRNRLTEAAAFEPRLVRKHFVYGSVAASASVVSLLAPLGLKSILTGMLGTEGAAGALLALDLLQRPFILIVSALQAIQYPDIVALYDHDGETSDLRRRLGEYYSLLTGFTFMTASGIFALLQPIGHFIIAPGLQQGFLAAAPFVTGIAVCRSLTQNMLPTPSHLRHRLRSIFLLSAADCLLLNGGVLAAGHLVSNVSDGGLMAGGMVGAILAMLIGIKLLLALPFDLMWQPVALSAAAVAIPVLATAGFAYNLWISVAIGIAGGGAFCLLGLHSYFTTMFRPRSAVSAS